jgi:predicted O-methyltransferase YrrM
VVQLGHEIAYSCAAAGALAAASTLGVGRINGASRRALIAGASAAGLLGWHRRARSQQLERLIRSAEDGSIIGSRLGAAAPLFGTWAAEGDFAGMVARAVEASPGLVVECGSGSTTIVIADRLRRAGSGRLVSLEHDSAFADSTARSLAAAGLADVAVVVHAPLREQQVGERVVEWYDRSTVEDAIDDVIDVLVVDGPPQVAPWARWAALPVLHRRLADNFTVLLDDGRTRATLRAVRAWLDELSDLELYWLDTVKGTWLLKRRTGEGLSDSSLRVARIVHPRPSGFGRWPVRR